MFYNGQVHYSSINNAVILKITKRVSLEPIIFSDSKTKQH